MTVRYLFGHCFHSQRLQRSTKTSVSTSVSLNIHGEMYETGGSMQIPEIAEPILNFIA
jgi:hypothetical protein